MWKKILKKILLNVAFGLLNLGLKWAFKAADANEDGVLTKEEIWNFIVDKLKFNYLKK